MNTAEITVTVSVDADDPTADLPGLLAEIDGKTGALDVGPCRIDATVHVTADIAHALLDEATAVEVVAALRLAASVHRLTGGDADPMAEHYGALADRFENA